jgi:hypothetical protein
MPATTLSKRKHNIKDNVSDDSLITLISTSINKRPEFQSAPKGVWLWNRSDAHFRCSSVLYKIMNIRVPVVPDFDFWVKHLNCDGIIKFTDALECVLKGPGLRKFIFILSFPNARGKIIQCILERFKNPDRSEKLYVIGVFCVM